MESNRLSFDAWGGMDSNSERLIAHRGLWQAHGRVLAEKNSSAAFELAVRAGFGIELDVRDRLGELVISHDPALDTAEKFEIAEFYGLAGPLAVNIKSDGLGPVFRSQWGDSSSLNLFFFDLSTPELVQFQKLGLPTCERLSNKSELPSEDADWIWVDSFGSNWNFENCEEILGTYSYAKLVFVSPELHGRQFTQSQFEKFVQLFLSSSRVYLCTDTPVEFLESISK